MENQTEKVITFIMAIKESTKAIGKMEKNKDLEN